MTRRATHGAWLAVFFVLAGTAAGAAPFAWFVPAPPPAGWKQLTLPAGALLSYPPSLAPVHAGSGEVSVAERDANGNYLAYLNASPQRGGEKLAGWAAFRIEHLRRRNIPGSVHREAAASGLRFRGGTGACVIDTYLTPDRVHRYREIACFVQGRAVGSVVIAAAPVASWQRVGPQLERAIAAYQALV